MAAITLKDILDVVDSDTQIKVGKKIYGGMRYIRTVGSELRKYAGEDLAKDVSKIYAETTGELIVELEEVK